MQYYGAVDKGVSHTMAGNVKSDKFEIVCPVMGTRPSATNTFSAIRVCGHIISDKALRQCQGSSKGLVTKDFIPGDVQKTSAANLEPSACLQCDSKYFKHELIPLARNQHVVDSLRAALLKRRALAPPTHKRRFKVSKRKRHDTSEDLNLVKTSER